MAGVITGDLIKLALDGKFDVIIHGCNCFCTMGGGIARVIQEVFPEAYEADCKTKSGDKGKLGTYTAATVERKGHSITIVNGYTQYDFAGCGPLVDYDAVRTLFAKLKKDFSGRKIGYPKIGGGLAQGDWNVLSDIIDTELAGEDHTLVEFKNYRLPHK